MAKSVAVRGPFDREFSEGTLCVEPGARQSEAEECDINRIVAQFTKTGVLPAGFAQGVFADVSEIGDFREAVERVALAEVEFLKLPPQLRDRFGNDALAFVEFASDPANVPELVKLGLAKAPVVEVPAAVVKVPAAVVKDPEPS